MPATGIHLSAGRQVEVRKYVDDMALVGAGPFFAQYLRDSYRNVLRALTPANMQVNPNKTVVVQVCPPLSSWPMEGLLETNRPCAPKPALGLTLRASYRQLKLDGQRAHAAFQVGDICVRCEEALENLEHIVHQCPHWNKERRESGLPNHGLEAPACEAPSWALTGAAAGSCAYS
eukprot:3714789-Amphidinium_carterae.1